MIDTYLLGTGALAADAAGAPDCLHVGARLDVRRTRFCQGPSRPIGPAGRLEVRAPDGRALGYLPPDDTRAVAELLDAGARATARVTGLVPAFQRLRVQLEIEVEPG
ncbi:MAG: hypothetical protein IRY87_17740 [Acetobacteraceae bacterium]|nr:hypothetical protein [Acetobacteraceae bacterium]